MSNWSSFYSLVLVFLYGSMWSSFTVLNYDDPCPLFYSVFPVLKILCMSLLSRCVSLKSFANKFVLTCYVSSAIFLDVVAISALVIYVSRVVLGYKQTWDRYQVSQICFPLAKRWNMILREEILHLLRFLCMQRILKRCSTTATGQ